MSLSNTALVKYIYLDVVGFTYKRPVEAQTAIITKLNDIVKLATFALVSEGEVGLPPENRTILNARLL